MILLGQKRKSLKVSLGKKKNMQLIIPGQEEIDFSLDASTSVVPPVANTSIDDSIGQISDSVMMVRSIT